MPRLYISADEEYPVFSLDDDVDGGPAYIDLTDDEATDYDRVQSEYDTWQMRLRQAMEKVCGYSV